MGNKTTRQEREQLEQYQVDQKKLGIKLSIQNQIDLFDQFSNLARYTELQELDIKLNSNLIENVESLKEGLHSTNVRKLQLDFKNTMIQSADFLPILHFLEEVHIDLSNTHISNIKALSKNLCSSGKVLYVKLNLSNTKIQSIKDLDLRALNQMKQLYLNLSSTGLENIETFVFNFPRSNSLEILHLDISQNMVHDVGALGQQLKQLDNVRMLTLNFSNTQVSSLQDICSGISFMQSIQQLVLDLSCCPITNLDALTESLKYLIHLNYLKLTLNDTKINQMDEFCNEICHNIGLLTLILNFRNTQIDTQALLRPLNALNQLQFLKLSCNNNLEPNLLGQICEVNQLKTLILDFSHSTVDSINILTNNINKLLRLQHFHLILNDSKLHTIDLHKLVELTNLRTLQLNVKATSIREINLTEIVPSLKTLQVFQLEANRDSVTLKDQEQLQNQLRYVKSVQFYID